MDTKQRYRRLRAQWGWGLLIVWIGYWLYSFPSGMAAIGYSFWFMLVLLLSPLAFAVSHVIARTIVDREEKEYDEADALARENLKRKKEAEDREREEEIEEEARKNERSITREALIRNLGTAGDMLKQMLAETDATEVALLRVDAISALRDVVVRTPEPTLVALLRSERALQVAVAGVIRRLERAGLEQEPEAKNLMNALVLAYNR